MSEKFSEPFTGFKSALMRVTTPVAKAPVPSMPPSWPLRAVQGNCCLQKEGELLFAKGRGIAVCKRMLSPASCDALETDFNGDVQDDGDGGHAHSVRQIHLSDAIE
jgi:hypothetical protein